MHARGARILTSIKSGLLIALSAKNVIQIVEVARDRFHSQRSAAGDRDRRRRKRAQIDRHHGVHRHDRLHRTVVRRAPFGQQLSMAEPQSRKRKSLPATPTSQARADQPLTRQMTCKAALCTIANGCAAEFRLHSRAAQRGDADAVHRMRIALTRLRTAIRFFAPGVDSSAWTSLQREAAWLNRTLGAARDIDVALEREYAETAGPWVRRWSQHRDTLYKVLRRSLASLRYKRFIAALKRLSNYPTTRSGAPDAYTADGFSAERLDRMRTKLLRKGRRIERVGQGGRHRLRIRAKRLRYALEWSLPLFANDRDALRAQIKRARTIQGALGRLHDSETHQAQAKAWKIDPLPSMVRLGRPKSTHRLLRTMR